MDKRQTHYLNNKTYIYDNYISINGTFKKLYDRNRNIQKFLNLLRTKEMYMDDPNLGLSLQKYLFESNVDTVQNAIEADITYKLAKSLPVFAIQSLSMERDVPAKEAYITLIVTDLDYNDDYDINITVIDTNIYVALLNENI